MEEDLIEIISGIFQLYALELWLDLLSPAIQVGIKATNKMHLMLYMIFGMLLPINVTLCLLNVFVFKTEVKWFIIIPFTGAFLFISSILVIMYITDWEKIKFEEDEVEEELLELLE